MIADIATSVLALILVVGMILGLAWFMRRFRLTPIGTQKGHTKELHILEQQIIDSRNRLILVAWRGDTYLLASGDGGVKRIASKPHKPEEGHS